MHENIGLGASNSDTKSILLVDDEEAILPEYQEFLELEGYTALISTDPEQAFRSVMERPDIGLVITDLRMAKLDGATLIRKIRAALPIDRKVEFIILTGDASAQPDVESLGVPILIKPADTDELIAAIKIALAATK